MSTVRSALICDLSLQKQANQELASMLGDAWANTFETIVESKKDASKKAFAGWQGPEEQPKEGKKGLYLQELMLEDFKPEAIK